MSEKQIINNYFKGVKLQNIGKIDYSLSGNDKKSGIMYFSRISTKNNRFVALVAISNENTNKEVELSELNWTQIHYRTYLDEETFDKTLTLPEQYNIHSISSEAASQNDVYMTKSSNQYKNDRNEFQIGEVAITLISLEKVAEDDIVHFPPQVSLIAALGHANTSISVV